MTATATDIQELNFIFADNSTYLNQSNWQSFFGTLLPGGFINHCVQYDTANSKLKINYSRGNVKGLMPTTYGGTIVSVDPVTSGEIDCLYFAYRSAATTMKLAKIAGINLDSTYIPHTLTQLLYALFISTTTDEITNEFNALLEGTGIRFYTEMLPLAYGAYNSGFWDLTRFIRPIFYRKTPYGDGTISDPTCGNVNTEYGQTQIYGGHKYKIDISASYAKSEYRLYPVPVCSLDPATILIMNNTSGAITLKLPLNYHSLYFDYFQSGWTESSGFLTYSLAAGTTVTIEMKQFWQSGPTEFVVGDYYYPKSYYQVTQY